MARLNAAIALVAAAAAFSLLAAGCGETTGSSSKRTIYSFVYALKHHNYGRACSYLARDKQEGCAEGFTFNVGVGMVFGGVDAFSGIRVKPGSEQCSDDTHCVYTIDDPSGVIGAVNVTVVEQDSGRWRIVAIG